MAEGTRWSTNSVAANDHPSTSNRDVEGAEVAGGTPQSATGQYATQSQNQPVEGDLSPPSPQNRSQEQTALEPPITKNSLSELDVNKIVNNPKLRHDINFDADVHFRPNFDGEKGWRKTQTANDFWETMRNQLSEFLLNRKEFERKHGNTEWALPVTLKAIRGILETLVPPRDRASVEETFHVEILMEQFRKGMADIVKLANWLSQLLKCHCAPMRDDWIDEMVAQLCNGDRNGDVTILTLGIKNLLSILEAMKLDVANHQIRYLRPLLIEDTVHFEQNFFLKKIAMGRIDITGAHRWFRCASSSTDIALKDPVNSQGNIWDFIKALLKLTLPSTALSKVPHTFLFDKDRLIKLRSDMLDLINLEICMHMYHTLDLLSRSQSQRVVAQDDTPIVPFNSSPCSRSTSPSLLYPTVLLPHHFATSEPKQISSQSPFTRVRNEDENFGSPTSSTNTSPSLMASTPESYPPIPFYLSTQTSKSNPQVRSSLLAILSSSNSLDKWSNFSSSLALQILRSTTTPLIHLPQFESRLAYNLSNTSSPLYEDAESQVVSQITPMLHKLVETYTPLTSIQIFDSATALKAPHLQVQTSLKTNKEEINDFATRLAHIGTLHWRVWAHLAYLVDPAAEEKTNERTPSTPR